MTHVPTVWRFVSVASSVVGFVCYCLSSSFPTLFGKRIWWKIFIYVIFGIIFIIICFVLLFAKKCQRPTSRWTKALNVTLFFITTVVYSFFWDKLVKVKPDAYILISSVSFAIMSLSLEIQTHCGVEADLLSFFCATLTAQLMKIQFFLFFVGAGFCYSLVNLRAYIDAMADPVLPVQNDAYKTSLLFMDIEDKVTSAKSMLARRPYEL